MLPPTCHLQTAFLSTQAKAQLVDHQESKHPKATFADCFPTYTEKE